MRDDDFDCHDIPAYYVYTDYGSGLAIGLMAAGILGVMALVAFITVVGGNLPK